MLKKGSLILAVSYSITLLYISLKNLKDMPKVDIDHADKIFHFIAYAILSTLWFMVFKLYKRQTLQLAILKAVIFSIIFGIIIEVMQGTLTTYRAFDVYDAIANSMGALLIGIIIYIQQKLQVKIR